MVLALGLLAAGLLFEQLVDLALLVVISIIIALPVAATATWLERFHIPRALGAVLSVLAGGGVIAVILIFVVPAFARQVDGFVGQLPDTVKHFEHAANHIFGLDPEP